MNERRRAFAALSLALALSACVSGQRAESPSDGQFRFTAATEKGSVIPAVQRKPAGDFSGELLAGGSWRLSEHRGRVVIVNFWATWCGPCVLESPLLNQVYLDTRNDGVDFVGIDIKDERAAATSFIEHYGMAYPMIFDEPARAALQLGVPAKGLPVTVAIDRQGRVAGVYLGVVLGADIRPVVSKLAGET